MNQATADFIQQFADADVLQLALRGTKNKDVDLPMALEQIAGRQTARGKLPSWAATDGIVYPPHLSLEQCSSEQTARYKKLMVQPYSSVVDLTGGFGVDFSFLAQGAMEAVYVERQKHLCEIASSNFKLLGLRQAKVVCGEAEDYLLGMGSVDLIYMDPARRDSNGSRTYGISDCTPDVLKLLPLLLQKAGRILLKLSPMLDWRKAVSDLGPAHVSEVHIVSVHHECKELLVLLKGAEQGEKKLVCVDDDSIFDAPLDSAGDTQQETIGGQPSGYLYEPNASIMKGGCFAALSQYYGVTPLARNSHLFVSDKQIADFPGRTFHIEAVSTFNKRELKEKLGALKQANITVRNFPMTVVALRQRLKISEGGSTYIFATTLANGEKVLLICRR